MRATDQTRTTSTGDAVSTAKPRQKVAIFGPYTHGGIPRRQMLPEVETCMM